MNPNFYQTIRKYTILILLIFGINSYRAQNNYLNFDGTNDYVQISNNLIYDFSGDFTIEIRTKKDVLNTRGDLFTKKDNTSSAPGTNYIGVFINTDNKFHFYTRKTPTSSIIDITSITNVSTTNWISVSCVRSGSTMSLYINGILEATGTNPDDLTSDGPIRIGSNKSESLNPNSSPTQLYNGDIDEVRIWNYARSPLQIQNNIGTEINSNEVGLIGYYNFNQGVPCSNNINENILIDNSATANDGILTNFDLTGNLTNSCESNWNGISTYADQNQNNNNQIKLYPNPVYNQLKILINNFIIKEINILDITGKMIKNFPPSTIINVETLPKGIYFIKVVTDKNTFTQKFIKE